MKIEELDITEDERMFRCKICGIKGLMLDLNYHFKKVNPQHPEVKPDDWEQHVELIDDNTGEPVKESRSVKEAKLDPAAEELIIKDEKPIDDKKPTTESIKKDMDKQIKDKDK